MGTGPEASRARTTLIVLGVIALATCVVALGVGLVLKQVAEETFGPPRWGDHAVLEAELPKVFGVRLPSKPTAVRSRAQGFQDMLYEALLELPPGGKDAFLAANGLTVSAVDADGLMGDLDGAKAELRTQRPGSGPITAVVLDGVKDLQSPDGGYTVLFRSAVLLEADGRAWVYLVAFST